jgi:hypothetical protein
MIVLLKNYGEVQKMGFGRKKKVILKKIILFIIIVSSICALCYYGYFYYNRQVMKIENKYINQINDLKTDKYMSKRTVYVAKEKIDKGEIINSKLVNEIEIFSNFDADIFMSENDIGAKLLLTVNKDNPILKSMLYELELEDDERLKELSLVLLQSDLKRYEFVDFRIRYSNGLEYIVLSKKEIKKIDLKNNTVWLSLNEEERLMLSSALVDKSIYLGTSFYVDRYEESNIQKESHVNYLPNIEVMNLIDVNNITGEKFMSDQIAKRIEIENKLINTNEEQLSNVEKSISDEENNREERVIKETSAINVDETGSEKIIEEELGDNEFN